MSAVRTELKAKDIMVSEPVCVDPSTTIVELVRIFEENEISGAPVTDNMGRVIGVVSKTDLIRRCSEGTLDVPPAYLFEMLSEQSGEDQELNVEADVSVQDFMTEDPVTVGPDTPIAAIAREMAEAHIHRVIVVDDGQFPIGIITSLDLLGAFPG